MRSAADSPAMWRQAPRVEGDEKRYSLRGIAKKTRNVQGLLSFLLDTGGACGILGALSSASPFPAAVAVVTSEEVAAHASALVPARISPLSLPAPPTPVRCRHATWSPPPLHGASSRLRGTRPRRDFAEVNTPAGEAIP
jgi:hypothetical protein